ncbi:hypothetical protein BGX38DRAFT_1171767 [Terfezia claveryi]|nr:hypothetical protein BGX38DRAFT_1171767 [Terfezia claveryi]
MLLLYSKPLVLKSLSFVCQLLSAFCFSCIHSLACSLQIPRFWFLICCELLPMQFCCFIYLL